MKIQDIEEAAYVLPSIDRERYDDMPGMEGPMMTKSGKVIYYDPKLGAYYDRDSDMYLSYDEFKALDSPKMYKIERDDVEESGILYRAGVKKYGKAGMKAIQSAAGSGASAEEIGAIKDKHKKKKKESIEEALKYNFMVLDQDGRVMGMTTGERDAMQMAKGDNIRGQTGTYVKLRRPMSQTRGDRLIGQLPAHNLGEDKHMSSEMATLRSIVDNKQAEKVHGMMVDMFTASAMVQVYDKVNDENQAKMREMLKTQKGFQRMADFALSKISQKERAMYITEAMISSMEDMQKNASEMEKHIKGMMEIEARSHGLELDSRHNARDMWAQLSEHMASMPVADPMEHTHADTGVTHSHAGGDVPHSHDDDEVHVHEDMDGLPSDVEPAPAPAGEEMIDNGDGTFTPTGQ